MLYNIILYDIIYIKLYILYYFILFYIILCYIMLYYIILYYISACLYWTILGLQNFYHRSKIKCHSSGNPLMNTNRIKMKAHPRTCDWIENKAGQFHANRWPSQTAV